MKCEEFLEGISVISEGGHAPEAKAHIATCRLCSKRLEEFKMLSSAAKLKWADAPPELISRVSGLMPQKRTRRVAHLLANGRLATGARSIPTDSFVVRVVAEDLEIPLDYSRIDDGWVVMGRSPGDEWSITESGRNHPCGPHGRFIFRVNSLRESGFQMKSDEIEVVVPSAAELLHLES